MFAPRTFIVSILVGVIVTLLAGLFPALRATRVPPIAAVREGAELPRGRFARFSPFVAGVFLLLSLFLLGQALFKDDMDTAPRLLSIVGGVLLLFIAVAMLSRWTIKPLAAVVGWPATRIGGAAGKLARGNSTRNTQRTASTAAALMIGVALVTFVAVLANGFKASNRDAIESQVSADFVITAQDGFTPFVAGAGDALADSGAAEEVSPVRSGLGKVSNSDQYVTGIDPAAISEFYNFDWAEGSDDSVLDEPRLDDGAIVSKDFAEDNNLKVGSPVTVLSADNKKASARRCRASTSRRPSSRSSVRCRSTRRRSTRSTSGRATSSCSRTRTATRPRRRPSRDQRRPWPTSRTPRSSRAKQWITQQDEEFN